MEPDVIQKPTSVKELKELVQRFRVCWKVWPEFTYVDGEKRQIGYELELAGTHEPWVKDPEPGCKHCQRVFMGLQEIAAWILPREERPSVYEIGPYHQSLTYWSLHRNRPDVMLKVKILHRQGWDRPIDECEDRCLKEMEQRLRELGAGYLSWR